MRRPVDEEIQRLQDELARRQFVSRGPQPIAETLSQLLARRGYAAVEAAGERDEIWSTVVGPRLAPYCRVGLVRRGVLEVIVANSVGLQELTMQKKSLLAKLVQALPDQKIRDLRFRIGAVT
jgi:predicted nucleic acid-binding Zn ribbon protein